MTKVDLDETTLVKLYEGGLTMRQIATELKCSRETVRRRLHSLNVNIRPKRQYQFKYSINVNAFNQIDSEESAYWLGFMFADGWVSKDEKSFGLFLKASDRDAVEKFKGWLEYSGPVLKRNGDFPQAGLKVARPEVVSSLISKGCVNAKTGRTKPPVGVPDHLVRHFIRGLFDGDGGLSIGAKRNTNRLSISIIGDEPILKWVAEKYPNFSPPRKASRAEIYVLAMDGAGKPEAFLDWLYQDCSVYLDRKHALYLRWKAMRESLDTSLVNC